MFYYLSGFQNFLKSHSDSLFFTSNYLCGIQFDVGLLCRMKLAYEDSDFGNLIVVQCEDYTFQFILWNIFPVILKLQYWFMSTYCFNKYFLTILLAQSRDREIKTRERKQCSSFYMHSTNKMCQSSRSQLLQIPWRDCSDSMQ